MIQAIAVVQSITHFLGMKILRSFVAVGIALAAAPALAGASDCELSEITSARELHHFLSLRAVEVVRRAGRSEEGLDTLIEPSASFSLGAGDVGRPMGAGADGARKLAETIRADSYRFLGWDFMDMPADACAQQKVEVEFVNNHAKRFSRIEFTFVAGVVVSATGWERSFESGEL